MLIGQIGSVGWYIVQRRAGDMSVPVFRDFKLAKCAIAVAVSGKIAASVCDAPGSAVT